MVISPLNVTGNSGAGMSLSGNLKKKGISGLHGGGGDKCPGTGPSCFDGTLSPS